MANKSKCPYCNAVISRMNVEDIDLERDSAGPWKGVTYACPVCKKILSVATNPDIQRNLLSASIQSIIESAIKNMK